jgi:hypothetical protein
MSKGNYTLRYLIIACALAFILNILLSVFVDWFEYAVFLLKAVVATTIANVITTYLIGEDPNV